jgi:capsular exopolysaccharide synthesis family protein
MVTSVMENEGKSTVAVNIALALAQKYDRVLLLESDLRKPACHTIMNQKDIKVSLKEVLLSNAKPEDAVIQDRASGLYMMLDAKGIRNPGDLLGSKPMADLIQWCRDNFDFVVMDLPPMSVASDSESILEFADGSMLVIRQNVVRADALNRAIVALKRGKAKFTGCVLNNVYTTQILSGEGYHITATAIYTPMQAYLAAKAGAEYAAPYVNRIDNLGADGVATTKKIHDIYVHNHCNTRILAAGFKNSQQVQELCEYGVSCLTIAPDVIENLIKNANVTTAVEDFVADFESLCGKGKTMLNCEEV